MTRDEILALSPADVNRAVEEAMAGKFDAWLIDGTHNWHDSGLLATNLLAEMTRQGWWWALFGPRRRGNSLFRMLVCAREGEYVEQPTLSAVVSRAFLVAHHAEGKPGRYDFTVDEDGNLGLHHAEGK